MTLSLYAYFGAQLIGAQMVEPPPEWGFKDFKEFDLYVPVLTIIEVGNNCFIARRLQNQNENYSEIHVHCSYLTGNIIIFTDFPSQTMK